MIYAAVGGAAGCRKLAEAFYGRVEQSPVLRPLFPGKSLHCAIEEFAAFLVELLDEPGADSQRRWWVSLRESHARFRIGPRERKEWLRLMAETLEASGIEEAARAALREFFERSSAYVVNSVTMAADAGGFALAEPWRQQLRRDEAVAAIRRGDAARAIAFTEQLAPAHRTGLIAEMTGSGEGVLVEYAARVAATQVGARFGGRTLLHVAAGKGELAVVAALLQAGTDPNVLDAGGHTPLYAAGNEAGTAEIVRALVAAGADVHACGGVKRCTALHMAARRGNLAVARALIECGAEVGARDSKGVTPRQRALNCRKSEVAALLARGR